MNFDYGRTHCGPVSDFLVFWLQIAIEPFTVTLIICVSLLYVKDLGPVVQSIVSLTSSLVVKMQTFLVSAISNFANAKATHIFSAKILANVLYLMIKVLTIR